jgi:hypothetical protein
MNTKNIPEPTTQKAKQEDKYFNGHKVDITKFITSGKTELVVNEIEAQRIIRTQRGNKSYHYPVYNYKQQLIGYGIPK